MFERNVEITNVGESMHFESVLFPTQRQTIPFVDDPRGPTEKPRRLSLNKYVEGSCFYLSVAKLKFNLIPTVPKNVFSS